MKRLLHRLRQLVAPPLVFFAALVFLAEEWLWERLRDLVARLARLPGVARAEARIAALPPYAAMALFLVPIALLEPVKLACLYFMGTGHFVTGLVVLILAKIVGTAIVARLFTICRPALLTIAWFARLHDWILRVRARLYARLAAMPAWHAARRMTALAKARLAMLFGALANLMRRFFAT